MTPPVMMTESPSDIEQASLKVHVVIKLSIPLDTLLCTYHVLYFSLKCSSVVPSLLTISVERGLSSPPISKRLLSGITQEQWWYLSYFSLCSVFSQVLFDHRRQDLSVSAPPQISPEPSCVWPDLMLGKLGRLQGDSPLGRNFSTEEDSNPPDMRITE